MVEIIVEEKLDIEAAVEDTGQQDRQPVAVIIPPTSMDEVLPELNVGEPVLEKPRKKMGRPRKEIDWDLVDKLLFIQCTVYEIACVFECNHNTLNAICKREHGMTFRDYSNLKRGKGCVSLRRRQWASALGGNIAMQIWLGKQYLRQGERIEHTGANGGPLVFKAIFDYGESTPQGDNAGGDGAAGSAVGTGDSGPEPESGS